MVALKPSASAAVRHAFDTSETMSVQPVGEDDSALHQALVESEAEERHRQDEQSARERAEFALALAASRRSPTPPASSSASEVYDFPTPTSSRPHSPPVPAFSEADLARSAYYPNEKSVHHPQGRPALPPGAGGAWDDEMREMEMLALAIRISQEEEEERKRIEEHQLGEALRESERQVQQSDDGAAAVTRGPDSASATSSLAPRITPGSPPSSDGSFEQAPPPPPPPEHASPRSRRSSWIQPPLASSMARQGSNTSADGSAETSAAHPPPPPRPPRPTLPQLDASGASSASTVTSAHTGSQTPSTTSPRTSSWQASPPKPKRAPPPPPPPSGALGSAAATSLSPLPRFDPTSADELWRKANDGSPLEMPNLTPSSSIRGHHAGIPVHAIEGAHAPAGSPRLPEQLVRRISQASSGSYTTALSAPLDDDEDDETDLHPAPFSPLSIRNPDFPATTPSDGSRSSTLSSTTSAGSDPASQDPQHWPGGDGSGFPLGATAISAYAGRSMSAISELTEPVSSAAATEDGASERTGRADSFPSTVSIDAESRYESSPQGGEISERNWIAGRWNGDDVAGTPRPPRTASPSLLTPPHAPEATCTSSSSITHTPPTTSADHSGPSSTIRPRTEPQQVQVTTALAQDDGLRCGYPAECARELDHVCPADGLSASAGIPETVELASDLPPNHTSWAIEAHSWVALVRALMWYGDTVVTASPDDLADSPSTRCAATASLEFRSDDEDVPILRLVLALLPPRDPASHQAVHRELCVQKSQSSSGAKGKGKARAGGPAPSSSFLLPDVVHLPARLSSLAIQLYSLRHLASIARATQPSTPLPLQARGNGTVEGYPALRDLADAISTLAQAAQGRRLGAVQPVVDATRPSEQAGTSEMAQQPAPDQTERLLHRLRARLRGLKRHRNAEGAVISSEDEDAFAASGAAERNPPSANKLVKPRRRSSSQPPDRSGKAPESERRAPAHLSETSDVGEPLRGDPTASTHGGVRGDMRYLPTLSAS